MQYVQNSLKTQLGMKVEIQVTDQQSFVPMLMQGKVSAWATLMFMGYADQYAALSNFSSKSPNNVYGYANPEVDALLLQSVTVQDTKARETLYNQIESKLLEDMPVMPIMWGKFYVMQRPYVSGYRVNVLGIMPFTNVEVK
jgi:ABC-type transport system substrate-binding protein